MTFKNCSQSWLLSRRRTFYRFRRRRTRTRYMTVAPLLSASVTTIGYQRRCICRNAIMAMGASLLREVIAVPSHDVTAAEPSFNAPKLHLGSLITHSPSVRSRHREYCQRTLSRPSWRFPAAPKSRDVRRVGVFSGSTGHSLYAELPRNDAANIDVELHRRCIACDNT